MTTISLCMVTKNGEDHLADAVFSAWPVVDEIIIGVDSRTTDGTRELIDSFRSILPARSIKTYEFEWVDSFSAIRNPGLNMATSDYILVLDTDEELLPEGLAVCHELRSGAAPDDLAYVVLARENGPNLEYEWTSIRILRRVLDGKPIQYAYRFDEQPHWDSTDLEYTARRVAYKPSNAPHIRHTGLILSEVQKENKLPLYQKLIHLDLAEHPDASRFRKSHLAERLSYICLFSAWQWASLAADGSPDAARQNLEILRDTLFATLKTPLREDRKNGQVVSYH